MQTALTSETSAAIPVTSVTKADLPAWIESHPQQGDWLSTVGFKGEPGSFVFVPGLNGCPAQVITTPSEGEPLWAFASLPTALPEGVYTLSDLSDESSSTSAALGWALGAYSFSRYRKPKRGPATLVWPDNADRAEVERVASSVCLARDLINTPAEDMGPDELVAAGRQVARDAGAKVRFLRGDELLTENYPTIHAVGRASTRPPALLDFRWGDEDSPKVTLVGKGVCFDTGGLDIKPREGMLEMKKDMGGAAVVLGLAKALMSANVRIRLRVLIPAVENSVAGNAIRPLDIVRTRLGKTVEIGNTDAEGRLILCDALAEADSEMPDLLIDCATLTGAARIALGAELQALFCDNDETALAMQQAGAAVGDPLWRMPIWRAYRKQIDGKCADLNNVATGQFAGSIIGALYLAEFVSAARAWVHLDIMASNQTPRPGRPEGGEATGMRALYRYICDRYA